jgi:hypothetical protein
VQLANLYEKHYLPNGLEKKVCKKLEQNKCICGIAITGKQQQTQHSFLAYLWQTNSDAMQRRHAKNNCG